MHTHSIERTSPKGTEFIGTCWKCGKTGLKGGDALVECENTLGLSHEEDMKMALEGPAKD